MNLLDPLLDEIAALKQWVRERIPSFGWATVTSLAPFTIETELNPTTLPASTLVTAGVGDRVWYVRYGARVVTVGKAGGLGKASQQEVDDGVDDTKYVTPATLRGRDYAPYAVAAGRAAFTLSNSAGGTTTVTFPAGLFSVPPVVTVTRTTAAGAKYIPYVASVTASGMTVGVYSGDGSTGSPPVSLDWVAVQMSAGGAEG